MSAEGTVTQVVDEAGELIKQLFLHFLEKYVRVIRLYCLRVLA